jgi:hypothetical protein
MRTLLGSALALALLARGASAQSEEALRAAFEGKTVAVRIDMPATSRGVDVHPLDPAPVDFHELARRLKEHGTALRAGQTMMVTKVAVKKNSHVEFQLGGGGYGTFSDWTGSDVHAVAARETKEERALREAIKRTPDRTERRRMQRELDALRSARERENARGAAEAQQANLAREASLRAKRAESGSRFNVRYREGIPPDALTPAGLTRALARYVDFSGTPASAETIATVAGAALAATNGSAGGIAALRKGQTLEEVDALLGPAAAVTTAKEGALTVTKRSYRRDGAHIIASFVSGVLIDFAITPQ